MAGIGDWSERRLERWLLGKLDEGIAINQITGLADFLAGLLEPGIIVAGGAAEFHGFLPCDGAAVSRTDYAGLFNKIGTTFGVGDGSTTFNVPNLSDLDTNVPYFVKT